MYIVSRTRNYDLGRTGEALAASTALATTTTDLTGVPTTTWLQTFAPTGPAIVWTARFEHLADFERFSTQLMGAAEYHDAMAELDDYLVGTATDAIFETVSGTPPAEVTPIISTVQARAVNGHLRATMHWGVDLAERFSRAMDVPTMFARGLYGFYGTVGWASYVEDMDGLEGTNAKLAVDEMLQAVMDEGAHNCQNGAVSALLRKLD